MAELVDLHWRIGTALSPEGNSKMPYRSRRTKVLAKLLGEAIGKGYNTTVIFDARRLVRRYPRRGDLPRFVTWVELRPYIRLDPPPPQREPKQNAALLRPGLLELRRLIKRAVLAWKENWLELPCQHPSALLFSAGGVDVVVRIIQPALRYIPIPALDEQDKTVLEVRWGVRPVIRCLRRHRRHSHLNVKNLRRCILDP